MNNPLISIVMITWNRCESTLATLGRLLDLPERPAIVLVNNGSTDGTSEAIRRQFPQVEIVEAGGNRGAFGRNLGVERVTTPYVAFCDDDSWPDPGCLRYAVEQFAAHPWLAILCGRVLVGAENIDDPICRELEQSPLPREPGMPGPPLLGFLAGASVIRREAFLDCGGFADFLHIGGEEELLAIDLSAAGWWICYDPHYVVHHHPSPLRNSTDRRATVVRNALAAAWLRRSFWHALRRSVRILLHYPWSVATLRGVLSALGSVRHIVRNRRVVPRHIQAAMELLESQPSRDHVQPHADRGPSPAAGHALPHVR